jgi:hypothetical protein
MTKQEACELINAKLIAAKALIEESRALADAEGIGFRVDLSASVEGTEDHSDGWNSSSWNC